MSQLRHLGRSLNRLFSAPAPKKADRYRQQRERAKQMAALHKIEIEKLVDGGMNVWAPAAIADTERDPFHGDHFAADWDEALTMVKAYAELVGPFVTQTNGDL